MRSCEKNKKTYKTSLVLSIINSAGNVKHKLLLIIIISNIKMSEKLKDQDTKM